MDLGIIDQNRRRVGEYGETESPAAASITLILRGKKQ